MQVSWILGAVLFSVAFVLTFRVTKDYRVDDDEDADDDDHGNEGNHPVIPMTRSGSSISMRTRSHSVVATSNLDNNDEPPSF